MPTRNKDSQMCGGSPIAKVLMVAVAVVAGLLIAAAVTVCLSVAGVGYYGNSARSSYSYVYPTQASSSAQGIRTITLTASGSASASPKMAVIQVYMNATGATPGLANANLSSYVDTLNRTLLPFIGGNMSLIQTTSYQISRATNCTYDSNQAYYYCVTNVLPYYVASESFQISVPSIKESSKLITALSNIPDLQMQGVQAQLSTAQQTQLGQAALASALANATSQAQLLAGSGVAIQVENITVESNNVYYPVYYGLDATASGSGAVNKTATFYGGSASVQKSIHVVFSIQ